MKYPQQQFNKLVTVLTELNKYFDISSVNPSALHFTAYQQLSEGQLHNRYVKVNDEILKSNAVPVHFTFDNQIKPLFEIDNSFLIYPEGCNDNHIETAVKAAIKLIPKTNN